MKRRRFLQTLLGLTGATTLPANSHTRANQTRADANTIKLLETPLAGFQYYEGEHVFNRIKIGDTVQLRRAPENKYDKRAVEVYWNGNMLGHIPRMANRGISQMMDGGEKIRGSVTRLTQSDDPWRRVEIALFHLPRTPSHTKQ